MKLGVQIVVDDPTKLDAIRERESDITKETIMKILNAGANVVLTTGGIDDLCLKYFIEAGAMAVRRCKKNDLKRIAKATGAQFLSTLANLEGEESFDATMLGSAEEVIQERISDDELILVKGLEHKRKHGFKPLCFSKIFFLVVLIDLKLERLHRSFFAVRMTSIVMRWSVRSMTHCA